MIGRDRYDVSHQGMRSAHSTGEDARSDEDEDLFAGPGGGTLGVSMRVQLIWLGALALGCACAGNMDTDSGTVEDSAVVLDGGGGCPTGQHRCGGGCVTDQANDPAIGCRLGCGEACPTPPGGVAACNADGMCNSDCEPLSCVELGHACGMPDDGCGATLSCGTCEGSSMCIAGECSCDLDSHEPNESAASVTTPLATMDDSDDETMTFGDLTMHASSDEDFYLIRVLDGTDLNNPDIEVTLDSIPAGEDYELAVYFECDAGTTSSCGGPGTPCTDSRALTAPETVAFGVNCDGITEDGDLFIRVRALTWERACSPYQLTVTVE